MPPKKKARLSTEKGVDDSIGDIRIIQVMYTTMKALQNGDLDIPSECMIHLSSRKKGMDGYRARIIDAARKKLGEKFEFDNNDDDDDDDDNNDDDMKKGEKSIKQEKLHVPEKLSSRQYKTAVATIRAYIDIACNSIDGTSQVGATDYEELWWKVIKAKLPQKSVDRYMNVCFGRFSKRWYPAIEIGPINIKGQLREQWFKRYDECNGDENDLLNLRLLCWYGEGNQSKHAFSFKSSRQILSYEEGVEQGIMKDKRIAVKQKLGKKLSNVEKDWLRRIEKQREDLARPKQARVAWMNIS